MIKKAEQNLYELYKQFDTLKNDFRNKNLYKLIVSKLRGRTLLDIGCGVGHLLFLAAKMGFKGVGVEPSKSLQKLHLKIYPQSRFQIIDGDARSVTKVFQSQVDNVTLIDVLEHISDDRGTLRALKKVLSKAGKLIIVVPAHPYLYGKRDKSIGHFRRYSKKELGDKLEVAGYVIEEIRFWNVLGIFPYFISEKILKRELRVKLRENKRQTFFEKVLIFLLDKWFFYIENNIDFMFGLSLICVAKKA